MKTCIQTYGGLMAYPLDIKPEQITLADICHSLSLINRFNGHTRFPVSVAAHTLMVAKNAYDAPGGGTLEVYRWALLHDAAEAYLNDMTAPLKRDPAMVAYREAEKRVMAVVCEKFGLPPEEPVGVKAADLRALATERRDAHMTALPWSLDNHPDFVPYPEKVVERDWRDVRNEFRLQLNLAFPGHTIPWSAYHQ